MNKVITLGVPSVLIALVAAHSIQDSQALPTVSIPNAKVWLNDSYGIIHFGSLANEIQAQISYDTEDQSMVIRMVDLTESGLVAQDSKLDVQLTYWPTAISTNPDQSGEFLIAGFTPRGRTIMEKFKLQVPTVSFSSMPSGPQNKNISVPKLLRVTDVFEATTPEMSQISDILWGRHSSEEVFARFYSSNRVYRINLVSQSTACVVSPTPYVNPDGELPVISDSLGRWLDASYSVEHIDHGYVYYFYHTDTFDYSIFEDRDKNGSWEEGGSSTASLWAQKNYGNESKFLGL